MKIQYIAVIFIIIALPISMVTAYYIGTQIDTIKLQIKYNESLTTATHDAITAFQINTTNNMYSSVSDSKIRDIEASVSTFFNSLSSNENLTVEDLKTYIPALVFTLYDGYYIYSKYDNAYLTNNGQPVLDEDALNSEEHETDGLKPYIYYSCRYKKGLTDFVVNYTLDNAITIYGILPNLQNGGYSYQTLSGYLINPDNIKNASNLDESKPLNCSLIYDIDKTSSLDDIVIGPELLKEHLLFSNNESGDYEYLSYNGQKIYYDPNSRGDTNYFYYQNYGKTYLTNSYGNTNILNYLKARTKENHLYSTSAFEYYKTAKDFSDKVIKLTKGISQQDAKDENGNKIEFSVNTGSEEIFIPSSTNDPLLSGSTFDENRKEVIKRSIETNLTAAIAQYSVYNDTYYEFALPKLEDTDWEKITNKVSVLSFMQGMPIGHKIFNNYKVIANDENEETINKESIYIVTENTETGEREYHLPGCLELAKIQNNTKLKIIEAYSNLSFIRQTVRISEGNYWYFYPQVRQNKNITSCYHCVVNASNIYQADQIILGKTTTKSDDKNWEDKIVANVTKTGGVNDRLRDIRKYYMHALARERYDLYRANIDSFSN